MTAFSPGQSPPPVSIPIFIACSLKYDFPVPVRVVALSGWNPPAPHVSVSRSLLDYHAALAGGRSKSCVASAALGCPPPNETRQRGLRNRLAFATMFATHQGSYAKNLARPSLDRHQPHWSLGAGHHRIASRRADQRPLVGRRRRLYLRRRLSLLQQLH